MLQKKRQKNVGRLSMREYVKNIHFIGIGGSGMSGIAEVLVNEGYEVTGSDRQVSEVTKRLESAGVKIFYGHHASNIDSADAVVRSTAIAKDNVELVSAQERMIPIVRRAEMLGELMRFRKGIAIAGTHGKTTTTSILAHVVADAGLDPTFVVGGLVNSVNSNSRLGKGEYLIAEADESDASFLHLFPLMAVITNIDADHMDTYHGDFEGLKNTFVKFLSNLPFYGVAILCKDDENVNNIIGKINRPMITYGTNDTVADYRAINIKAEGYFMHFDAVYPDGSQHHYVLNMPGLHNVQNAMVSIVVADQLEIGKEKVAKAINTFPGVGRRFQFRGQIAFTSEDKSGEFLLIEDYAHHPTEIKAILSAARNCWPEKRVVVVFQPHRYSRTKDLLDDFSQVLSDVDNLLVMEVYPAGEAPISGADGRSLCKIIRNRGLVNPVFVEDFEELAKVLAVSLENDDVVLMLGAGDIGNFAKNLQNKDIIIKK